ncbi:MAG: SBBP repeat-containing protein [Vicinamibacterales bacterium]
MTRTTMTAVTVAAVLLAATTIATRDAGRDPHALEARPPQGRQVAFEENRGQHDARARYVARGANFSLFLTDTDAVLAIPAVGGSMSAAGPRRGVALRLAMVGAQEGAAPVGEAPLPHRVNYLKGSDASRWVTGVPTYGRVRQRALRPGVDVVWYASAAGTLEYDVDVAPAADPAAIEFELEGAERLEVTETGGLRIHTGAGVVEQDRPVAYQDGRGVREPVESAYELRGPARVGFRVGAYDDSRTLVIDPNLSQLAFSTYLGGSDLESLWSLAVDKSRNVYVAGVTQSFDFPTTPGSLDPTLDGSHQLDVFVTKLNAAATTAVFSTYLGGTESESRPAIAVDANGRTYVVGTTDSDDYPVTRGAFGTKVHPFKKAFVTQLTPDGDGLEYSTFLHGPTPAPGLGLALSEATGVAVDAFGNAYVVGRTTAADFPLSPGAFDTTHNGSYDFFAAALDRTGSHLIFSTLLGGSGDEGEPRVVLAGGAVVVAGSTRSPDYPTTAGALDGTLNGGPTGGSPIPADGVITVLNATGSALVASTYLGGSQGDSATAIALGADGHLHVAGTAQSADFPTTAGAFDRTLAGVMDGFVAKLPLTLDALLYSTLIGGTGGDSIGGMALEPPGCPPGVACARPQRVFVTGNTSSVDFPMRASFDATFNGGTLDAFVSLVDATGATLAFSTFFGGPSYEYGRAAASDGGGNIVVAGTTRGSVPAAGDGVFQKLPVGTLENGFIAKFGTHVVSGRILDDAGRPVSGVTVTASIGFAATAITDLHGFYVIDLPTPLAIFRVTPSLSGASFTPAFRQFTGVQSNRVANFTRLP